MLGSSVCGSGLCQALSLELFALFPPSIDLLPLFVLSLPSLSSEVLLISVDHSRLDSNQLALFKYIESISCLPARILFVLFAWWLHLHPSVPFPSSDVSSRLLSLSQKLELVFVSCCHCQGEIFSLPPTVVGRISRSMAVCFPPEVCVSAILYATVQFPVLLQANQSVGHLRDSSFPMTPVDDNRRDVLLASDPPRLPIHVCDLITPDHSNISLSMHDPPQMARRSPIQSSALRACLGGQRAARVRIKWTYPLSPSFCQHGCSRQSLGPPIEAAFSDDSAAMSWNCRRR